ncbi:hypothetical protein CROQUDRAFT_136652 [Cronartium quercuum f. sp. fusiforme G11]|uniref:CCHC-type domain-containing protein n=1 Tax=Cronartium quercuum f. sp. fusiforme G11 TaxID=708437 RepID=A0A9P6NA87_9BASI|nr:hypothetical protein CROQUDRAFT_136652 [Cronartium quercuum f. sp. fusiforme G11]
MLGKAQHQNLHQQIFVQQPAGPMTNTDSFAVMLKAVPVKIDNISKLLSDGSNFDVRAADVKQYLTMIPGVADYLKEGALPMVSGWKDDLAQGKAGLELPDDVFVAFLAVGVPRGFPDITHSFEATILANPKTKVTTAAITRALGASDIAYKRQTRELTKVLVATTSRYTSNFVHKDKSKEKCHYCNKKGHYKAVCRKRIKDEANRNSLSTNELETN